MRPRPAVVVLLLALTGCTGGGAPVETAPSSPATSATPTEAPPRATPPPSPEAGRCHRLSYEEAVSPSAATGGDRRCRRRHTSETFRVADLDTTVEGRLLAVDSRRVERQVSTECPRYFGGFVGGTEEQRRLSMLRPVWFTPTVEQSDQGAGWYRCDAVVLAGSQTLLPVTGSLGGVLDTTAGRERFGICSTAEPGTRGFRRVVCEQPHTWRAIRTVRLDAGDYPGEERARTAGEDVCRAAGRAAGDDPLDFEWGYEWPTAEQWRAGQTWGLCWVPD